MLLYFLILIVLIPVLYYFGKYSLVYGDCNKSFYVINKKSANILCNIDNSIMKLIAYMETHYPGDKRTIKLKKKYKHNMLIESNSEAYTIGKRYINICLKAPMSDIMYVIIHELSHLVSNTYGHDQEFFKNFKFLLNVSKSIGIRITAPNNYCKNKY
jgi:hypothetical protein